jgi:hypothetical protein
MGNDLSNFWDGFGQRLIKAMLSVCLLGFALLVSVFVCVILFRDYDHSYNSKVLHFEGVNNEVRFEKYCDEEWCGIRLSLHSPDLHGTWTPVIVYNQDSIDVKGPGKSWLEYIEPRITWLNSGELEISINKVDQILYRKEEGGGKKIVYNIGMSACPEKSAKSLLYGLRGEYWIRFGPDSQCSDFIKLMMNARSDVRRGEDTAEVWKRLHEHGVTDEDIWRIGL